MVGSGVARAAAKWPGRFLALSLVALVAFLLVVVLVNSHDDPGFLAMALVLIGIVVFFARRRSAAMLIRYGQGARSRFWSALSVELVERY